jgi:DNA-directed RNA polymerase beta subunit
MSVLALLQPIHLDNGDSTICYVFYNGEILGMTTDSAAMVKKIRSLSVSIRNSDRVHTVASIFTTHDSHIYVNTDEGRVVRPFICTDWWLATKGTTRSMDVDDLIQNGYIRYIDAAECGTLDVAMSTSVLADRPCDLLEIHPHLMLGVTAACIPFPQ